MPHSLIRSCTLSLVRTLMVFPSVTLTTLPMRTCLVGTASQGGQHE